MMMSWRPCDVKVEAKVKGEVVMRKVKKPWWILFGAVGPSFLFIIYRAVNNIFQLLRVV